MGLCKLWLEFITKVTATQAPFKYGGHVRDSMIQCPVCTYTIRWYVCMHVHNTFRNLGIFAGRRHLGTCTAIRKTWQTISTR